MSSELLQTYERGQSTIRVAISAEAIYDSDFLSVVTTPEWDAYFAKIHILFSVLPSCLYLKTASFGKFLARMPRRKVQFLALSCPLMSKCHQV